MATCYISMRNYTDPDLMKSLHEKFSLVEVIEGNEQMIKLRIKGQGVPDSDSEIVLHFGLHNHKPIVTSWTKAK